MINKETLLNKKTFWIDKTQNVKYQFREDGIGLIIDYNNKANNIKWELLDKNKKQILKINKNGIFIYYIFEKLNEDKSYLVTYKTKDNELKSSIYKTSEKYQTKKENSIIQNEDSSKYNKADKLFIAFIFLFITFFISLLIKLTEIFSQISIVSLLSISLISSTLIVIYLREPIFYISKKYNNELKELFKFLM